MTIWARRSLFRQLFDMDEWELTVQENNDTVLFELELQGGATFDLESFEYDDTINTLTAVGQNSAELIIEDDFTGFRVEVPRSSLPEDYLD